jgi:hypothetical protein
MNPIEIQNRIYQVEASIEQMKSHENFNEMEKRENLVKLNKELESLYLLKAKNIEVKSAEEL